MAGGRGAFHPVPGHVPQPSPVGRRAAAARVGGHDDADGRQSGSHQGRIGVTAMTNDDRERFGELLALLGEVFNEPVTPARVAGYWLALDDLPFAGVHAGVQRALNECRLFPPPAEIRAMGARVSVTAP